MGFEARRCVTFRALIGANLAVVVRFVAIVLPKPFLARIAFEGGERRRLGLGCGGLLAFYIFRMWKSMRSPTCSELAPDPPGSPLGQGPEMGVVAAKERLARVSHTFV